MMLLFLFFLFLSRSGLHSFLLNLALSPPCTTKVPYAKQLGLRWDPELFGVSSGSKMYDTQTIFSPTLSDIEALWKLKQMRNKADGNYFCGQSVNPFSIAHWPSIMVCVRPLHGILYNFSQLWSCSRWYSVLRDIHPLLFPPSAVPDRHLATEDPHLPHVQRGYGIRRTDHWHVWRNRYWHSGKSLILIANIFCSFVRKSILPSTLCLEKEKPGKCYFQFIKLMI